MKFLKENFKSIANISFFAVIAIIPFVFLFLVHTAPQIKAITLNKKQEEPKIAIEAVFKILGFYEDQVKKGSLTLAEGQDAAMKLVKELRYSGKEYFWIHDRNLKMVMHPFRPDLDGKDISKLSDPEGKFLFREMNEVALKSPDQAGYVAYMWAKPGKSEPQPKMSYVKYFESWGWVVGSGVYTDDVMAAIESNSNEMLLYFGLATLFSVLVLVGNVIAQLFRTTLPIKKSVIKLDAESATLNETADQLSEVSQNIQSSSYLQSESLVSTTSALTEINAMLERTQSRAQASQETINKVKSSANNGFQSIGELTSLLLKMGSESKVSQTELEKALQQMKSITNVISLIEEKTRVIDEIVFQTKLLSFNASVEAARAGESGKGFTVVASEIGTLATRSGMSAAEINQIITQSKSEVQIIATSLEKAIHELVVKLSSRIDESSHYAQNCRQILQEVVKRSDEAEKDSTTILQATEEVRLGTMEISNSVNKIELASKENLAAVEKTTEGVNSLINRSGQLKKLVEDLKKTA